MTLSAFLGEPTTGVGVRTGAEEVKKKWLNEKGFQGEEGSSDQMALLSRAV